MDGLINRNPSQLSPEAKLLCHILSRIMKREKAPWSPDTIISPDFRWNYFYYLINREGLTEYIWSEIKNEDVFDSEFKTSLKTQLEIAQVWKLNFIERAVLIQKKLNSFNIPFLWENAPESFSPQCPNWTTQHHRIVMAPSDFLVALKLLDEELYLADIGVPQRLANFIEDEGSACLRSKSKGRARLTIRRLPNFARLRDFNRKQKVGLEQLKFVGEADFLLGTLPRKAAQKCLRLKTVVRISELLTRVRMSDIQDKIQSLGLNNFFERIQTIDRALRSLAGKTLEDPAVALSRLDSLDGIAQRPTTRPSSARSILKKTLGFPYIGLKRSIRSMRSFTPMGLKASLGEFVPTSNAVVTQMLDHVGLRPGQKLVDLGSGDGRVVIEAARRGANAIGCEVDKGLIKKSWQNALEAGVDGLVDFKQQQAEAIDLSEVDIVSMYTNHFGYGHVLQRVLKDLPKGARVVSHQDIFNSKFLATKTFAIRRAPHSLGFIQIWEV